MSYMKQIAEMLGLAWDEEFGSTDPFLVNDGENNILLYFISGELEFFKCNSERGIDSILYDILNGTIKIKKLPWKPKQNEVYFYVMLCDDSLYDENCWCGCSWDEHRLKHNLVFKTQEEAIARANEILKLMEENK